MVNSALFHLEFHFPYFAYKSKVANEMIFALFLLGTAGLTGTTITWLARSQRETGLAFGLTLVGFIASWILGFSAEEIFLVCLPIIVGCSIFCSSMFGPKKFVLVEAEEKGEFMSVV